MKTSRMLGWGGMMLVMAALAIAAPSAEVKSRTDDHDDHLMYRWANAVIRHFRDGIPGAKPAPAAPAAKAVPAVPAVPAAKPVAMAAAAKGEDYSVNRHNGGIIRSFSAPLTPPPASSVKWVPPTKPAEVYKPVSAGTNKVEIAKPKAAKTK